VTDYERLLRTLSGAEVEFIIVGGVAATLHGSARLTEDLDIVYARRPENLERLARALAPFQPYLRGAPPGLPFRWDAETLHRGLNFTLTTELGDIDVLGEIAGDGTYESLLPDSRPIQVFGVECLFLSLARLIQVKRAAGRPKDFDALAELERIAEERANLDES
jgi:predicted nucleotidyltransferase